MKKLPIIALILLIVSCITLSVSAVLIMQYAKNIDTNVDYITDNRSVKNFNAVVIEDTGKLIITQGESESLTVTASDKMIDDITTEVVNGTLTISRNNETFTIGAFWFTSSPTYKLTVKDLNSISIKGTGDVQVNELATDNMTLKNFGVGNIIFDELNTQNIDIKIEGTGNVELTGSANTLSVSNKGVGNFDGTEFKSNSASVHIEGTGNANVWATETLDASIKGIGNITYYGSPKVTKDIEGLGNIKAGNKD